VGLVSVLTSPHTAADGQHSRSFEVTITNVTKGQTFTPILVASHRKGIQLFELGSPASAEIERVAETGDTGPLGALLSSLSGVRDVRSTGGLLGPGESVTVTVDAPGPFRYVSVVAMLIPTNDGFFALNGVEGPAGRERDVHFSVAYDAGTEVNDEDCSVIPGPQCGGSGDIDAGTSEGGVVHVNAGISGAGSVSPHLYDWRNPVARIVVQRAR
jgi:hypothetical protein